MCNFEFEDASSIPGKRPFLPLFSLNIGVFFFFFSQMTPGTGTYVSLWSYRARHKSIFPVERQV